MVVIITETSFVGQSLINNLFYMRTLRELCLALELTFYKNNNNLIEVCEGFRKRYEQLEEETIKLANNRIPSQILESNSFITDFTLNSELLTEKLFDVDINTNLTVDEINLVSNNNDLSINDEILTQIRNINTSTIEVTNNFIDFCRYILNSMKTSETFSYSYPLIYEYIINEAGLYVNDMERLQTGTQVDPIYVINFEYKFSNSMKQACQFIIGLSDPNQTSIITNADNYRKAFSNLMKKYQDSKVSPDAQKVLNEEAINLVESFKIFLAKIIEGILNEDYYFIMNVLFFDNLLTEANYFLYLLQGSDFGLKS